MVQSALMKEIRKYTHPTLCSCHFEGDNQHPVKYVMRAVIRKQPPISDVTDNEKKLKFCVEDEEFFESYDIPDGNSSREHSIDDLSHDRLNGQKGHVWLKPNSCPKQVRHEPKEFGSKIESSGDDREWKEVEIDTDDLPYSGLDDTMAHLQMNCSVYAVYHNSTYEEHNYSKLARITQNSANEKTPRDEILRQYRRRELRFEIKFREISSSVAETIS